LTAPADAYVFAGGGTGGHLYPALAIAGEIRKAVPAARICFIGTKGKIESRVVPAEGYEFRTLWISGLRRSLSPGNLLVPLKAVVSLMQAWSHLRELRPRVVVGTGGYVSGPVLLAASMMRIPTLIHEQNSVPGETTKFLAKRADEVHVSFGETMKFLPPSAKAFLSGCPTRGSLRGASRDEGLRFFGMDPADRGRVLLVSGGSLGARSVNSAVLDNLDRLLGLGLRILWQTGQADAERIAAAVKGRPRESIWTGAFVDRMDLAYAAADAALCRAGATTIAELTRLGKPAILVPYPLAAADHQTLNAGSMEKAGAAVVIADADAREKLVPALSGILSEGRLAAMGKAGASIGRPDAAAVIARHAIVLGKGKAA
jgi:UDP-N-acetylglucosamine--N-acetylmuramyl-(pentapeptide) pyrophosphoryl-undecaprenol N-acetylglucosamine transferase